MKTTTVSIQHDGHGCDAQARRLLSADGAYRALEEILSEVFRPARKHGYADQKIAEILDGTAQGAELISLLEAKFHEILQEHGIDLDDA